MIADYYIVKRGAYTADILKPRDGRYWYLAGRELAAIAVWLVGAVAAYLFTWVWPTPVGATIPAFLLTFVALPAGVAARALDDAERLAIRASTCRMPRRSRQRMLHDLSHPIRTGMQVYPGDPTVDLAPPLSSSIATARAVTTLHLGSHTGTHVDAPAHTVAGGRTMDAVSLDELVGDALVMQCPGSRPRDQDGRS